MVRKSICLSLCIRLQAVDLMPKPNIPPKPNLQRPTPSHQNSSIRTRFSANGVGQILALNKKLGESLARRVASTRRDALLNKSLGQSLARRVASTRRDALLNKSLGQSLARRVASTRRDAMLNKNLGQSLARRVASTRRTAQQKFGAKSSIQLRPT